jgi:hypothetical protein
VKTPNFAMDTTDIDSNADRAQERFTSHLFDRSLERVFPSSGSAVRVPSDMSNWPPAELFDAVYASTVLRHFGFQVTHILERWGNVFYPGGPIKANDRRRHDQADVDKENSKRQTADRQQRHERRDGRRRNRDATDPYDLVLMYRFQAMEPEKVRAYLKGSEEIVAARERKGLEEKVNSWRESLGTVIAESNDDLAPVAVVEKIRVEGMEVG